MKAPGDADASVPPLRRRDFLALGSVAALAPWMAWGSGRAAAAETSAEAAGAALGATLPLSIGYLEGSDELSNLRRLASDLAVLAVVRRGNTFTLGRHMLPAQGLPAGDPSLVGGPLRMTVHDLYPRLLPNDPKVAAKWPAALDLDVAIPLLEPPRGSTATYLAWSYRRLPAENRSARVSFLLWPDWYSDLMLTLRVVPPGKGASPRLFQSRFSLGADSGRPKLQKGVYLLGTVPGAWDEDLDLPTDPSLVPPELLSVLVTVEPEGARLGSSHRG
jgi:hypothetical protein